MSKTEELICQVKLALAVYESLVKSYVDKWNIKPKARTI